MIPGWKVRRELWRVVDQFRELPARLLEPLQRWRYERTRWSLIKVHGDAAYPGQKLCVFLVYQPSRLAPSVLETLDFLSANGYATLLVANAGLTGEALSQVLSKAWRVMERPNFGYDFGGYRDALHFLDRQEFAGSHLILLNDSIWFPMLKTSRVIEHLEASPLDMTGLFLHVPARNELEKESNRLFRKRKLAEHIESYLTMIPRKTLLRREFAAFWQTYPQTRSKTLTIRRGEIGFSKAMAAAGLSIGALSRRSTFLQAVAQFSDHQLEKTLVYAAYSDAPFQAERDAILQTERGPTWRTAALEHIRRVVERRRFNASFCWATEEIFGTTFLKKHPGRIFQEGRRQFLRAVDNGDLACDNLVALEELRQRVAKDFPATDGERKE